MPGIEVATNRKSSWGDAPLAYNGFVRSLASLLLLLFILIAPVAAEEGEEGGPITLVADEQRWEGDVWRGLGSVRILYQDIKIQCDEMEYNRTTQNLVARGNIIVDQGPSRIVAEELYYDLGTKSGLFVNGKGFIDPMYTFEGREIEKIDEFRYRIDGATFHTCDTDDPSPPWSFTISKARLKEEGFGKFTSTALRVQGVPVFYLPYVVWPIKRERSPGLLMPAFGYSEQLGFNFGLPIYVPLGRSYDTTVLLDYYSEGFYGLGNEWRWVPREDARGMALLYAVWSEASQQLEWKYNLLHTQENLGGFRLLAELENLSDIDFFQDFDRTFESNTRRSLYSQIFLTRTMGIYTLNLRVDNRRTFLTGNDVDLIQIPEVELRVPSSRLGQSMFYWDLLASANYFKVDRGGDLKDDYARFDVFPTLSYTLPSPLWLSVTPRVGGRGTFYTKRYAEDRLSFEDEPIDRTYVAAGVDIVGPSISRIFDKPWGPYSKFKHVVEPRIEYSLLDGTEDTSQIPVFDEVDSTPLTNRARQVLANRLLARSREGVSARELGSFELSQSYSFDEALNTDLDGETSQWGPLGMLFRITPTPGTGFDAQALFDTLSNNPISTSLAGSLLRPEGSIRLTWFQSYFSKTGERTSSQAQTMINFRKPGFPLEAGLHVAYDLEKAELQNQRYSVRWGGSCWAISASYRDFRLGQFPNREFRVIIELKGVGALPEIKGSLGAAGGL
jgi:LPS-assembly protein